jgi:hypothetical protein
LKIYIVDFDWAGPYGQAKYPMGINKLSVRGPSGVQDGELIAEEHDRQMVSFLI